VSTCPYCHGTDVAHTTKGDGFCLDCERTWITKGQRRVVAAQRRMDWFDRLNDPAPRDGKQQ